MKITLFRKTDDGPFVALAITKTNKHTYFDIGVWLDLDSEWLRRESSQDQWELSEWDEYDHYAYDQVDGWLQRTSWLSLLVVTGVSKDRLQTMIEEKLNEIPPTQERW